MGCHLAALRPHRYNIQHFSDLSKLFHLSDIRSRVPCRSILLYLILLSLCWPPALPAAFDLPAPEGRWHAMAGAGVADSLLCAPLCQNPASLCGVALWHFTSAASRPYGLSELASWQLSACRAWPRLGAGAAAHRFGGDLYNETSMTLALAHRLSPDLSLGAALRYGRVAIPGYGAAGSALCDLGGQLRCSASVRAGFMLRNLFASRLGQCRESLPQSLQSGLAIYPAVGTALTIDLYLERGRGTELRCGGERLMGRHLILRAGFTTAELCLAAGFGLIRGELQLDYGFLAHPYLGLTHQCSIRYALGRKESPPGQRG